MNDFDHDRRTNEEQREEERKKNEAKERAETERRRFGKFVVAGNAGGAIASLSLVGTILGTTAAHGPIPAMVFVMLLVFMTGLGFGWLSVSIDARRLDLTYRFEHGGRYAAGDWRQASDLIKKYQIRSKRAIRAGAIMLILGCLVGLAQLVILTEWNTIVLGPAS